jgi:hypothetical protein
MTQRNPMIDAVFHRLSQSPRGLDCSNGEVLAGCGLLVTAILKVAFADPVAEAQAFCGAVMASVDPTFKARLMQQSQQPTLN